MRTSVVATSLSVVVLLLLTPIACIAAEAADTDVEWHVSNMHTHPWFVEVVLASFAGWILGLTKGFSSSADWLEKYLPSKPLFIVLPLDFIIFTAFGGYLGTALYNPASLPEALAAGLSWSVGLSALATKT